MKEVTASIYKQIIDWKKQKSLFPIQLLIVLFLIIITPLAYGSVETWAIFLIEAFSIFLIFTLFLHFILQKQIVFRYTPYLWGTVLFFLYIIFTLPYSIYSYPTTISLSKIATYLLLFVFIINTFDTKKRLLFLVWSIALFGSFYALSALLFREGHFLEYRIFSNSNYISLTFVNRNHFAGYLEMIIWLVVSLAILKKGVWRIVLFTLAFFIAFALFMSLSRGGIIALLSSFAFFNLLYTLVIRKKRVIAFSILFVISLLLFLFIIGLDPLISRFEEIQMDTIEEIGRVEYWKSSYALFLDKPWFGSGLGTFSTAVPRFQTLNTSGKFISHSHNDYIELLSEIGIIGFLIVVGTFLSFYIYLIRRVFAIQSKTRWLIAIATLSSIFAILIHSFFDFNFHIPSNVLLFSVLLAIAYLSTKQGNKTNTFSYTLSKRKKAIAITLLILILLISILYSGKAYFAEGYIEKANLALKEKKQESAIEDVERAIFIESRNASHHVKLADILLKSLRKTKSDSAKITLKYKALNHYEIAIKQNPNYAYYHIKEALLLNSLGDKDLARKAYEQAVYYSPTSTSYRYSLCNFYFQNNEIELGIKESKKVLSLREDYLQSIVNNYTKNGIPYDSISKFLPKTPIIRNKYITLLRQKGLDSLMLFELKELFLLEPIARNAEKHILYSRQIESPEQQILNCKNYLAQFPNSIILKKYLANAYVNSKNYEKAKSIYLNLIEENPYNSSFHYLTSRIYRKEKNTQMALNSLKSAVKLDPNNYRYRYTLGKEYMRNHLFQLAFSEFEACLKLNPEHKASQKAIEKIHLLKQE